MRRQQLVLLSELGIGVGARPCSVTPINHVEPSRGAIAAADVSKLPGRPEEILVGVDCPSEMLPSALSFRSSRSAFRAIRHAAWDVQATSLRLGQRSAGPPVKC